MVFVARTKCYDFPQETFSQRVYVIVFLSTITKLCDDCETSKFFHTTKLFFQSF